MRVTKIVFSTWICILFLLSTWIQNACAQVEYDLALQAQGRSYPLGGTLDIEAGSSIHLWGEKQTPLQGLVRGFLGSSHAGLYNSGQLGLELFPIGILGIKAGYELINNESNYVSLNCGIYRCKGTWERRFLELQVALQWKNLFIRGIASASEVDADQRDGKMMLEPSVALPVSLSGERFRQLDVALGYLWSKNLHSLVLLRDYLAVEQNMSTQFQYLVLRWVQGDWSAQVGGGIARSDIFSPHASFVGGLRWDVIPSIKLF